ncbi:MAG: class I SAM-dependent methyltransferase [Eggerthellaceae bacterium]|nr:class I SAM-dependent methyltransferase [Eggerthellaceae bacterium]
MTVTAPYNPPTPPENFGELAVADEALDAVVCGYGLSDPGETRFKAEGAHDPTPTPYFILAELFRHVDFDGNSHLLDVGCGTGRVLAFFLREGFPGRATGVELDPRLAAKARDWTARYANVEVLEADVLSLDLSPYSHFYLFNPFDTSVLLKFLVAVEQDARGPVTLIHMSDNGETYFYQGRPGWSEVAAGEFHRYTNRYGRSFAVYGCPQHYTIWRFDPALV